jgi:hypothetical protein
MILFIELKTALIFKKAKTMKKAQPLVFHLEKRGVVFYAGGEHHA